MLTYSGLTMGRGVLVFLVLVFSWSCAKPSSQIELSGSTMGTTYNIVVVDHSGNLAQPQAKAELQAIVDDALKDVNAKFSNWDQASEVSRFNLNDSLDPIKISADFQQVLTTANDVYDKSGGYFDVTLGPLIELWGFFSSDTDNRVPDAQEVDAALALVGQERILFFDKSAGELRKVLPEARIHLAAIAKGYGIDQVARALVQAGYQDFMVEIGGDLFTKGQNRAGQGWRIGIERPNTGARFVEEIVSFSGLGMATSGDYRNYFEKNGVRYSHIIDPKEGRPVTHKTASVTVIAETAALADAWATALLALGRARGLPLAQAHGIRALFIERAENEPKLTFETAQTTGFTDLQAAYQD